MTIEPITATVTKTGLGGSRASNRGWRVQLPDGTMLWAAIHARVRTLKIPTLQVGDVIHGHWNTDRDTCSISLNESPVEWVSRSKLPRPLRRTRDASDDG